MIFILNMEMLNYYIPFKALNGNYCFMFILVNTIFDKLSIFLGLKTRNTFVSLLKIFKKLFLGTKNPDSRFSSLQSSQ